MFSDEKKSFLSGEMKKTNKWEFSHESYVKFHAQLFDYAKVLPQTDISSIEILDNRVIAKLRKEEIKLIARELDERSMVLDILNYNIYEVDQMEMIHQILSYFDSPVICDVGANMGFTSCVWGKQFPQATIYAFEPIKSTYDLLSENIALNQLNNVKAYNVGLSDKNEEVEFYFYPWCTANTSLNNLQHREDCQKNTAEVRCLDDIDDLKGKTVDFLKVDVEGNELYALKGAKGILQTCHPVISMEILRKYSREFGYTATDVVNEVKQYGYELYYVSNHKLIFLDNITEDTAETNFIFLHMREHKNLAKVLIK